MRPKFKYSDLVNHKLQTAPILKGEEQGTSELWLTPEKIPVKNVFTEADLQGIEHLDYAAGLPPFLEDLTRECTR